MHARSRTALPFALALGLVAMAQPARAQEVTSTSAAITAPSLVPSTTPAAPAVAAPVAGPTVDAATVGVRHTVEAQPAAQRRGGSAAGMPLMIVGGAAILVGIVVGGDAGHAISIGGAVVGLVGLYQYLQ
jgi:hypothetical protein